MSDWITVNVVTWSGLIMSWLLLLGINLYLYFNFINRLEKVEAHLSGYKDVDLSHPYIMEEK